MFNSNALVRWDMPSFRLVSFAVIFALLVFATLAVFYALVLSTGISLDFVMTVGWVERTLAQYTQADIKWHRFGTLYVDTVLPVAYTAAGFLAFRRYFKGSMRVALSALVLAGMCVDFWENTMNLQLLDGQTELIARHVMATWIKFSLLLPALGVGLVCWVREALAR